MQIKEIYPHFQMMCNTLLLGSNICPWRKRHAWDFFAPFLAAAKPESWALHFFRASGPPSVKWVAQTESYTWVSPTHMSPGPVVFRPRLSFDGQSLYVIPCLSPPACLPREPASLVNHAPAPSPRAAGSMGPSSPSGQYLCLLQCCAQILCTLHREQGFCRILVDSSNLHLPKRNWWQL